MEVLTTGAAVEGVDAVVTEALATVGQTGEQAAASAPKVVKPAAPREVSDLRLDVRDGDPQYTVALKVAGEKTPLVLTVSDIRALIKDANLTRERTITTMRAAAEKQAAKERANARAAAEIARLEAKLAEQKSKLTGGVKKVAPLAFVAPVPQPANAVERKAIALEQAVKDAETAWTMAYTAAFERSVAQQKAKRGADLTPSERNAAMNDDAAVKKCKTALDKAQAAFDKDCGDGRTYRVVARIVAVRAMNTPAPAPASAKGKGKASKTA